MDPLELAVCPFEYIGSSSTLIVLYVTRRRLDPEFEFRALGPPRYPASVAPGSEPTIAGLAADVSVDDDERRRLREVLSAACCGSSEIGFVDVEMVERRAEPGVWPGIRIGGVDWIGDGELESVLEE